MGECADIALGLRATGLSDHGKRSIATRTRSNYIRAARKDFDGRGLIIVLTSISIAEFQIHPCVVSLALGVFEIHNHALLLLDDVLNSRA